MTGRSFTSWPLPARAVDPDAAWEARQRRFLRDFGRWCRLCEKREWRLLIFWLPCRIEVHHCRGRGVFRAIGDELDSELMALCRHDHRRITNASYRLARQRGFMRGNKIIDPLGYSHCVTEATDAARPRYVARAIRRWLIGKPTTPQLHGG